MLATIAPETMECAMSDTLPTATRVSDPGLRALYRQDSRWQAWLDVEVALAKAQEELGIIPQGAAAAIGAVARLERLDRNRIDEGLARTGHTLVPLVWELSRVTGEPHGGWVHWGATTQNITQTGDLLILRQAHHTFLGQLGQILGAMAVLAERGAEMALPGRTHGQHAVPATFGYKVAAWIDEILRHVERLEQAAPRLFVAMLGGGAGTFASLGRQGPAVQSGSGKHLGFGTMAVPSRALGDHLAENICLLAMLAATCGKIGREIYTLMKTEFGEVEEPVPPGTVGSSTMPQEAQPEALPGHHRARRGGARASAARTRGHANRARGRPHHLADDGRGRGARGDRHRRHVGPAIRGRKRAQARSETDARQPRP